MSGFRLRLVTDAGEVAWEGDVPAGESMAFPHPDWSDLPLGTYHAESRWGSDEWHSAGWRFVSTDADGPEYELFASRVRPAGG